MNRNEVFTVKIYFIEPVEIIKVVIDALVKLEFETYTIGEADKEKLPKVLKNDIRNVLFISLINEKEVEKYLPYIDAVNSMEESHIQIGAFIHDHIRQEIRMSLLERNVAVIRFSDIKQDTLQVIKKILTYFEAKGSRIYVRVKTTGKSEAYFTVKNLETPIKAKVLNISSHAFLCKINESDRAYFTPGEHYHEVLLVLKGIRVRTSARIIGFNKDNPLIYILLFRSAKVVDNKLSYTDKIPAENKNKLHNYIKICLRENLADQLKAID